MGSPSTGITPAALPGVPAGDPLYDRIGREYARYRKPDARIARAIRAALGGARRVLNVGAGAGAYEPRDCEVVAVEPSLEMIRQRAPDAAPVVQTSAEKLPFADRAFDATLAILTLHHWVDRAAGLRELQRVARERVVLLVFDPDHTGYADFWLVKDYFPEIPVYDRKIAPSIAELEALLGPFELRSVPVPHDCADGFLGAYWRRPSHYLDARARAAISSFRVVPDVDPPLARLRADIDSGRWATRNAALLDQKELDLGYRLIIARGNSSADDGAP
jgi:SAM-dependent methyltransferase